MPLIEDEIEHLPDLYQRWLEAILPSAIPREYEANCLNCAMCETSCSGPKSPLGFFNPATKCCTYFPELPNFLVGRIIADDGGGPAALRAFIQRGGDKSGNVTLRAVEPPAKVAVTYTQYRDLGFGRDEEMLCPYAIIGDPAVGPLCGIWRHRNAICSTWFCKHQKGKTGQRFWRALQGLLQVLEWNLSWWAVMEVIEDPAKVLATASSPEENRYKIVLRQDAWKAWPGDRASFYIACAERVEALTPTEVLKIGGVDAEVHRLELQTRHDALRANEPPARLRVGPYTVLARDGDRVTIQSSHFNEPLNAPAALLPVLHCFDGQPTGEALDAILEQFHVRLTPGFVRRLYDFAILAEAEEATPLVPGPT